jgi:hypothetical protein
MLDDKIGVDEHPAIVEEPAADPGDGDSSEGEQEMVPATGLYKQIGSLLTMAIKMKAIERTNDQVNTAPLLAEWASLIRAVHENVLLAQMNAPAVSMPAGPWTWGIAGTDTSGTASYVHIVLDTSTDGCIEGWMHYAVPTRTHLELHAAVTNGTVTYYEGSTTPVNAGQALDAAITAIGRNEQGHPIRHFMTLVTHTGEGGIATTPPSQGGILWYIEQHAKQDPRRDSAKNQANLMQREQATMLANIASQEPTGYLTITYVTYTAAP